MPLFCTMAANMFLNKRIDSILAPYADASFVLRQKALVFTWMVILLVPLICSVGITNLFRGTREALLIFVLDVVFMLTLVAGLALVRAGKYHVAVNIVAALCATLALGGFIARLNVQAASGFNPYTLLMLCLIMFTAFFATRRVHLGMSLAIFVFNAAVYARFYYVAAPHMQDNILTIIINTLLVLVIVIGLTYLNARITDRALDETRNELIINKMLARSLEEKVEERARETLEYAAELFSQQEQYQELVENIEDIVYVCDWKGNFKYMSPAGCRRIGYDIREMCTKNYVDIIPEAYRENEYLFYRKQYQKKISETFHELPIMSKDGSVCWMEQLVKMTVNAQNEVEFHAIARDITARKKAEEALRESEKRYRSLIESAMDAIYMIGPDRRYRFMNLIGLKVTGFTMDELRKMRYEEIVLPEYRDEAVKIYEEHMSGASPRTYRELPIRTKSGDVIWVGQYVSTAVDTDGNMYLQCISRDITERRQMEKALRESEEKYRRITENMTDIIAIVDSEALCSYVSPSCKSQLGYPQEEVVGRMLDHFIHPDDIPHIMPVWVSMIDSQVPGQWEARFKHGDGYYIWLECASSVIPGEDGTMAGIVVSGRDITARKAVENALRESEEKFRRVTENMYDIISIHDPDLKYVYVSPSVMHFTGYSPEHFTGSKPFEFFHPDDVPALLATYQDSLARLVPGKGRGRFHKKDGSWIWLDCVGNFIFNDDGSVKYIVFSCRDITDRKKVEEALLESEERYRRIMDNITDSIFICDYYGKIRYMNPAGALLVGYTVDEVLGKNYLHFLAPEYRERELALYREQVRDNIVETHHDYPVIGRDGSTRWFNHIVRMARNPEGEILFYGVARDITARKHEDDERRELEEQKTRFFDNVSHEIRTPLTLMLSPIESYLQGDYRGQPGRPFFENLYRNGLRLLKLVNNLLDYSKIEAGRMRMAVRPVMLDELASYYISAVSSTAQSRGIAIRFEAPGERVTDLYADHDMVDKIFMNLLSNALKFTDAGGTVTVGVDSDADYCRVRIGDTGTGIPADKLGVIFERFVQADDSATRRYEGTGIGLSLARELAAMHGGTIDVVSRFAGDHPDDHGSVFTVTLRRGREFYEGREDVSFDDSDRPSAEESGGFTGLREMEDLLFGENAGDAGPGVDSEKPRVVVVDDNPDMRSFLVALLEESYAVNTYPDGMEALDAIGGRPPELVITDVMMPRMDGNELTARIKADPRTARVPVIMLTARSDVSQKIEGFGAGADDYLIKPFNSRELLARTASLIKRQEYEKELAERNSRMEEEYEVARLLQMRLLPDSMIDVSGYRVHAVYIPMEKVGGDFYDYKYRERTGEIELSIADVSGHGMPGAFLATVTKMALEGIDERVGTVRALYLLNDVILRSTVKGNFVTMFFCRIDTHTNVMRYASAGHLAPVLFRRRTGELIELNARGKPLGWLKSITLEEREVVLEPGDRLVLYTDGIVECADAGKDLFGDDRFREFIAEGECLSAADFCDALILRLKEFNDNNPFRDDLTMIVFDVL